MQYVMRNDILRCASRITHQVSRFTSHVSHMTGAIIVAAGISSRMTGQDKLFALLAGRPVLAWTVTAFEAAPEVDVIAVVVNPATLTAVLALSESEGWRKVVALPPGGARRQDSCANGLAALAIACGADALE